MQRIYAEVMRNRLEKEVEEKNMIPKSQVGFRKDRSTIEICFKPCNVKGNKTRRR